MSSSVAARSTRSTVLGLYRLIMRSSKTSKWSPQNQEYIANEARTLFKANSDLDDPQEIQQRIEEAKQRIELANHYGIPQPRLANVQKGDYASKDEINSNYKMPSYMASYKLD